MKPKTIFMNVLSDERANIRIDNLQEIIDVLEKDIKLSAEVFKMEDLPEYLGRDELLAFITDDKHDLEYIDYMASEYRDNGETIIVWASQKTKPHSYAVPVVSLKQIENYHDMLNWHVFQKLGTTPDGLV